MSIQPTKPLEGGGGAWSQPKLLPCNKLHGMKKKSEEQSGTNPKFTMGEGDKDLTYEATM